MILALVAFVRLWCATHPRPAPAPDRPAEPVQPTPGNTASPADSGAVH